MSEHGHTPAPPLLFHLTTSNVMHTQHNGVSPSPQMYLCVDYTRMTATNNFTSYRYRCVQYFCSNVRVLPGFL